MKRLLASGLVSVAPAAVALFPAEPARAAGAATCAIVGGVSLGAPLKANPRMSSYTFTDMKFDCSGTADINGVWNATSSGNSMGILGGGETCQQGSSAGPFSFGATSSGGRSLAGGMTFIRVGMTLSARGSFISDSGRSYDWRGVIQFIAQPATDTIDCTSDGEIYGVEKASLRGQVLVITLD